MDIAEAAGEAEKIVEAVARVEPTMASIASMFVPGAAPIVMTVQPMIAMAVPFVEKALNDIAAGHGGDALSSFAELIGHLSKGLPNSSALTPTPILSGLALGSAGSAEFTDSRMGG